MISLGYFIVLYRFLVACSDFQTYDHFRDSYKLYIDGVQVESGTWAGDNAPEPIRPGGVFIAGQDQDKLRGEYNPSESESCVFYFNLFAQKKIKNRSMKKNIFRSQGLNGKFN